MNSEYLGIEKEDFTYYKKSILESQLNVLKTLKNLKAYKKLRSEELMIKISLKNKLSELQDILSLLDKTLPKQANAVKHEHVKEDEEIMIFSAIHKENPKTPSLEQELEEIKRKLALLQ